MFHKSKYLEGQNIYCQVWIMVSVIIMTIEPFFFLIRIFMNKRFDEKLHQAALEGDYAKIKEIESQNEQADGSDKKVNPIETMGETLMRMDT